MAYEDRFIEFATLSQFMGQVDGPSDEDSPDKEPETWRREDVT